MTTGDPSAQPSSRSYLRMAAVVMAAWLAVATFLIALFASGRTDLGRSADAIVIAAIVLCSAYVGWVLWQRRPRPG